MAPYDMPAAFSKALTLDTRDQKSARHPRQLRLATARDIPRLCAISASATQKFAGIPALADLALDREEPFTVQQWLTVGNIYAVSESMVDDENDDDEPADVLVGFVAAHPLDNTIYVAEIAVHADHQGEGIGGILVKAVCRWALERATFEGSLKARVSLTTYPDVPWNGPWYRKFGFREVEADVIGPWHVEKMTRDENERRLARDGYRRCCMLWEIGTGVVPN